MYYYSSAFSGGPGVCMHFYFCRALIGKYLISLSGGFDVPRSKCLPDGGSSDCVTGSPALKYASAYDHSFYSSSLSPKDPRCNLRQNLVYPHTPPTTAGDVVSFPPTSMGPQPIRGPPRVESFSHGLTPPPLSPA